MGWHNHVNHAGVKITTLSGYACSHLRYLQAWVGMVPAVWYMISSRWDDGPACLVVLMLAVGSLSPCRVIIYGR